MKILDIKYCNKKKAFEIQLKNHLYYYPYSQLKIKPSSKNKITETFIDKELGKEAFTYILESGQEDSIHIDQVLEYNANPEYLNKMLLYKLTLKAQKLIESKSLSKREIMRRMNTSPTQFYRLIDQTFYNKSIDQMIKLLSALDCQVDIVFKRPSHSSSLFPNKFSYGS